MKRIVLLLVFVLYGLHISAQIKTDSLYSIWKDNNRADSTRAYALEDYIYKEYFYSNPDSTAVFADSLFKFSKENGFEKGMVNALDLMGYNFFRTGSYPNALLSYKEGLDLANKIGYKNGAANILLKTGYIYHDNEDIVRGLYYYQKSLKIYTETNNIAGVGSIFNEFGSIYLEMEDYEKSLEYYHKSIDINNELNEEYANSAMYTNIGGLYLNKEEFAKAVESYNKGLAISKDMDDKLGIASGLAGLAGVYSAQENYKMALEYFQKSLAISKEIGDALGISSTLIDIGYIYAEQGRFPQAIEHCSKSLAIAKELGDINNQISSCEILYDLYKEMGNTDKALMYHEKMALFNDSLQTKEAAIKIHQMEFSKQMLSDSLVQVEKDIKVAAAHQEEVRQKDKNRNMSIAIGIFFFLLSGGFFSRWRYVKKSKAIIEKEKDRSEKLLLNILPASIAAELKEKGEAEAKDFDLVSMLFSDFKSFTQKSEKLSAQQLIGEINQCFKAFDYICEKYGIEKIKTIGDAYMAAGGLPLPGESSVENTVLAALEMQEFMTSRIKLQNENGEVTFDMRLGIHTGPVVAGIVGVKKFQYDIWGDTVNIASRMESNGEIGRVNISQYTYDLIKNDSRFSFESRGKIMVKGKGEMNMWFVNKNAK